MPPIALPLTRLPPRKAVPFPGPLALRRIALVLLCLAFAVPLIHPELPPLSDLPGHMGRYRIMLALDQVPSLAHAYGFRWRLVGNLGVDLLVVPLTRLFGLELATKLIVMAIPPLTVAGMIWLAREVHGRVPPSAWFALPLAYAYPFQFGFLNFVLAQALVFHAAALWLRLSKAGRLRLRSLLFIGVAAILLLTHVVGWALFCIVAFGAEVARQHELDRSWQAAIVRAGVTALPLALPLLAISGHTHSHADVGAAAWNLVAKLGWIVSLLRDRWQWFDVASAGCVYGLLIFGLASRRFTASPVLAIPALLCASVFVLLPSRMLGGSYADMRLLPFATALGLLSLEVRAGQPRLAAGLTRFGLAFVAIRLVAATISLARFDAAFRSEAAAVASIPRGASVLFLIDRPCTRPWALSRLEHVGSMAIVRRDAFVNDQWTIEGSQLLSVRQPLVAPFDKDPSEYVYGAPCAKGAFPTFDEAIARFDRRGFDDVWTVGLAVGRAHAADLQPVWSNGRSALYRVVKPAATR